MKLLVIGSGGREHALAWKLAQSPEVEKVYMAPGNAGTAQEEKVQNIDIGVTDIAKLLHFARENTIDLTVIGPEIPLSLGIVDVFEQAKIKCFGPHKACSQLEASKAFSKTFMDKYHIPTAHYQTFNDHQKAKAYLKTQVFPIVIKASGLAAGKGVVIAQNLAEACQTVDDMLNEHKFGKAGGEIVIEEFLKGEEASFIAICDGEIARPLASSQDHKARDDGDKGPNTGGMGAYSPAPIVSEAIHRKVMQTIINPVLEGMKKEGSPYKGFLYAGLMIMPDGEIKTLEFNCRLGDPETQAIMMRLNSDLLPLILSTFDGTLGNKHITWSDQTALGVVMATKGYPESYPKGEVISGLNSDDNTTCKIFHAGTSEKQGKIVTNGGRILCATALGDSVESAYQNAYRLVGKINWANHYYRRDIGKKAFCSVEKTDIVNPAS